MRHKNAAPYLVLCAHNYTKRDQHPSGFWWYVVHCRLRLEYLLCVNMTTPSMGSLASVAVAKYSVEQIAICTGMHMQVFSC